jgi:coenzyme Q-binding protein COQ10
MPTDRLMRTVDERIVAAPLQTMFDVAANVLDWPRHLEHYRHVTFRSRTADGGGVVEMSANRPFGVVRWPTWWVSAMAVTPPSATERPSIRFRHIEGITTGMDVEWEFSAVPRGTHVRIVHVWNGPRWPVVGAVAALGVIGPVFVHGIASRTLEGLAMVAERG